MTDADAGGRPSTGSGRVLVLDAHKRQALVAARSLGRRGCSVTAAASKRLATAGYSRHVDRRFRYPHPRAERSAFVDRLLAELRQREYDLLLPTSNATLEAVLDARRPVERRTTLVLPSSGRVAVGLDKWRTAEVARELGVSHPRTLFPRTLDAARVERELGYPVVVKQRCGAGRQGVAVCADRAELEREYARIRAQRGRPLVQEYVPLRDELGVYTLYNREGDLRAATVQRRLRTHPPEGGSSTLRETVPDPGVVATADRFLSALDWEGVAMVEFRVDDRTGQPVLLEVNPRFWGSLALGVAAGVDFPSLLYDVATTGDCEPTLTYRTDVEARHLLGDVAHLLARDDPLPALASFLRPTSRRRRYDVASLSDPIPMVVHAASELRSFLG